MSRVSMIDLSTASEEAKAAVEAHEKDGYRMTNEKRTLLHNVTCFRALEVESYAVDRELQKIVGKRAADLFEYAISTQNACLVCSTYFAKLVRSYGIENIEQFEPTREEALLMEYGRAMAADPKHVPDELFARLKARYSDEEIVVLTTMGVFMLANNYFNDILQVETEV